MSVHTGAGPAAPSHRPKSAEENISLLLFAAEPGASQVARVLQSQAGYRTEVSSDRLSCTRQLHANSFTLLLVEESAAGAEPAAMEALYEAAGTAVVLEVNFALADARRLLLQIRSALRRRKLEQARARAAAKVELLEQFSSSFAGLLLELQLAERKAQLGVVPSLERIVGLAEHLSGQLRT